MRRPLFSVLAAAILLTVAPGSGLAQGPFGPPQAVTVQASPDLAPPLYAVALTGAVTLTRDGGAVPLDVNAPVIDGDRVRTSSGRVELAASTWGSLFLDERSVLDVVAAERVRLVEGRLRVVTNDTLDTALRIDVVGGTVLPSEAGSS